MSLPTVAVEVNLYDGTGAPLTAGSAVFTTTGTVTVNSGLEEITAASATAPLAGGLPSAALIPTDIAGSAPSGWAWQVAFPAVPGAPAAFTFQCPAGPVSFTAAAGTPGVVTWAPTAAVTAIPNGCGVQFTGTAPAGTVTGTTYYVTGASGTTLSLAATVGGSAIAFTGTGTGTLAIVSYLLSGLVPLGSAVALSPFMFAPSGTPTAGQVPVATGTGAASAWGTVSGGGGGAVSSVFGRTGTVAATSGDYTVSQVTGAAPLASPALTGTPTAPTATTGTNTTQVATTAFVAATALGAGSVSSVFGRAGAVTATSGDYTVSQVTGAAPLASPALTGTPTAPTPTAGDSTTKVATTAFVTAGSLPALAVTQVSAAGALAVNTVTQVTAASLLAMTLPAPVTGDLIVVEREAASTASVTVTGNIRGTAGTTITLSLASESEMFLGTSSTWEPVADHKPLTSLEGVFVQSSNGGQEVISALGTVTTALAVNLAAGNVFTATLGGSPTATFTGAASGVSCAFDLYATQDATGGRTVTWPGSVTWIGGTAPVLNAGANALTVLTFHTLNGGTTWYGSQVTAGPALPLSVGNGGLGVSTLTAYGIIAGGTTTTGPAQQISLGTAGQVLTSNGAAALPTMQAAAGGGSLAGGVSPATLGLAICTGTLPGPTSSSGATLINEELFVVLATALTTTTISTLGTYLSVAGVTPGVGVNLIAIFSATGTQLGVTGDMTTALESAGWHEGTLTSGVAVTAGTNYYIGILTSFSGTAPAALCYEALYAHTALNGFYLCGSLTAQATMPSTITPSALSAASLLPVMYGR